MARKIKQIEDSIISNLEKPLGLSTSAVAEWRLWVHCFAYVIYSFELILDAFRKEMDKKAEAIYTGSIAWYNEMCYRFELGGTLVFDKETAQAVYCEPNEKNRIIKAASVSVNGSGLLIKVAKLSEKGEIEPLEDKELGDFTSYLDTIKFAGTKTQVVSQAADLLAYDITVYFDPSVDTTKLEENVRNSLDSYKTEQKFGGIIYRHKIMEAIIRVPGVVTTRIDSLKLRSKNISRGREIETYAELYAGYFDYSKDECKIKLINNNNINQNYKSNIIDGWTLYLN